MAGRGDPTRATPSPHQTTQAKNIRLASIELTARYRIAPLQQGALDKLCGLYGTINALRLALADVAPISPHNANRLFAIGAAYLHRKDGLESALAEGMEFRRRLLLARHLAKASSDDLHEVIIERPETDGWTDIHHAFKWIERSITDRKPVLAALLDGLDHFTVISGMTASTLQLFDSTGLTFVRRRSCGLRDGFHRMPSNGLLRIAVHRRP